jgi:hypothetical protein
VVQRDGEKRPNQPCPQLDAGTCVGAKKVSDFGYDRPAPLKNKLFHVRFCQILQNFFKSSRFVASKYGIGFRKYDQEGGEECFKVFHFVPPTKLGFVDQQAERSIGKYGIGF